MYTAKEAREKAKNSISDKTKEQLLAAEHRIESAVKKGEMQVYCNEFLGTQAVGKLNELGYKVENCSTQREGARFMISW